jgi:hypothetical protein
LEDYLDFIPKSIPQDLKLEGLVQFPVFPFKKGKFFRGVSPPLFGEIPRFFLRLH